MHGFRAAAIVLLAALVGAGRASAGGGPPRPPPAAKPAATGTVSGTVTDEEGRPLAGASVRVTRPGSSEAKTATSDAKGFYAVRGLVPGEAEVEIRAKGRVTFAQTTQVPATGLALVDAKLPPGVRYAGKVVDLRGGPVEGASVTAERTMSFGGEIGRTFRFHMLAGRTRTARDGTFEIDGLDPGAKFTVEVRHPHFLPAEMPGLDASAGGGHDSLEILVEDAAWIAGTVVDGAGAPVAGAEVAIEQVVDDAPLDPLDFFDGEAPEMASDARGRFVLGGLGAGSAKIRAQALGYFPGEAAIEGLEPGKERGGVTVKLEVGTGTVEGVVVDTKGAPVPGAEVRAWAPGENRLLAQGAADGAGRFRFQRVASKDAVRIAAQAPGHRPSAVVEAKVGAKDAKIELMRLGRFVVKVLGPDGQPVKKVTATINLNGGPDEARDARTTFVLDQGTSGLEIEVPIGAIEVSLTAPDCAGQDLGPYDVEAGQTIDGGTVQLAKP